MTCKRKEMTHKEWYLKGKNLFGEDYKKWKFKCPVCGNIQTMEDFEKLNIDDPTGIVAYSCIGRWTQDKKVSTLFDKKITPPCDYTNGGLLKLAKLIVLDNEGKKHDIFEFAED